MEVVLEENSKWGVLGDVLQEVDQSIRAARNSVIQYLRQGWLQLFCSLWFCLLALLFIIYLLLLLLTVVSFGVFASVYVCV